MSLKRVCVLGSQCIMLIQGFMSVLSLSWPSRMFVDLYVKTGLGALACFLCHFTEEGDAISQDRLLG